MAATATALGSRREERMIRARWLSIRPHLSVLCLDRSSSAARGREGAAGGVDVAATRVAETAPRESPTPITELAAIIQGGLGIAAGP